MMKIQKIGGCGVGGEGGGAIVTPPSSHSRRGSSGSRPSWLLFTIAGTCTLTRTQKVCLD